MRVKYYDRRGEYFNPCLDCMHKRSCTFRRMTVESCSAYIKKVEVSQGIQLRLMEK